ncbi:hypothetical protein LIER_25155 [Lithospermum erythrorhizon]|uniref:Uncharacterized protein n=1 Tax=Lithospermum erythrorhizon TaxID=34254 RepID=A0AAV3R3Q4_LITER
MWGCAPFLRQRFPCPFGYPPCLGLGLTWYNSGLLSFEWGWLPVSSRCGKSLLDMCFPSPFVSLLYRVWTSLGELSSKVEHEVIAQESVIARLEAEKDESALKVSSLDEIV